MFKLTPREQKLLLLLAALLLLGVGLRFALPAEQGIALQKGMVNAGENNRAIAGEGMGPSRAPSADRETESRLIVVHIAGAVRQPGVYHLQEGSRVYQALEQAGGGLEGADLDRINLAQPLIDGQQVFFPFKGEEAAGQPLSAEGVNARVNINTATREQLESLPGIGAVKAQNIINYRQKNGPFQRIEDLLEVSGIGAKTLEGIKELITVW